MWLHAITDFTSIYKSSLEDNERKTMDNDIFS